MRELLQSLKFDGLAELSDLLPFLLGFHARIRLSLHAAAGGEQMSSAEPKAHCGMCAEGC